LRATVFFGEAVFFGAAGFAFFTGAFLGAGFIRSCIFFIISGGISELDLLGTTGVALLVIALGFGAERTRRLVGAALTALLALLRLPPRIINT
jgi:hypothetical protein